GSNVVFTPLFLVSGFRALKVASSAMETTLLVGDQFVLDKNYYRQRPVARNDAVVIRKGNYETVKRVVGIGGDVVEGSKRQIVVNGRLVSEPYVQHLYATPFRPEMDSFGPVAVPAGKYFVMG